MPLEEVANIVDPVFRENYIGGIYDNHYDQYMGVSLEEALYDLTGAEDDGVVTQLIDVLIENDSYWPPDGEEAFYSEEYGYVQDLYSLGEHNRLWAIFRKSLLYDQRFFNTEARELIAHIFKDVHLQRDVNKQGPVYIIHPGDEQATFYRAREADDEALRKRIEEDIAQNLGPPPERLRKAGRLNPSGISAFYAAFDFDTCVAELRPPVGSIVIGAQFQITEPICVLDTTRFDAKPKEPNPFASGARQRGAQWRFMRSFMSEIAQPISRNDEHLDYVPTQAVAEYLVRHHRFKFARQERTIDAIIYGSAQHPQGKNIAILGDAAVVGLEPENAPAESPPVRDDEFDFLGWGFEGPTQPVPRIAPVMGTIQKRIVRGVQLATAEFYDTDDIPDDEDLFEPN